MNNRVAMLPGTFDPPTVGHLDIIKRAASLFDKLYVIVAVNLKKKTLFTAEERKSMLVHELSEFGNIEVVIWNRLSVELAKEIGANVIIRGLRTAREFEEEYEMALINKKLYNELETLFIPSSPQLFSLSSSVVKEVASFGGDISGMVTPYCAEILKDKYSC